MEAIYLKHDILFKHCASEECIVVRKNPEQSTALVEFLDGSCMWISDKLLTNNRCDNCIHSKVCKLTQSNRCADFLKA